MAKETWPKERPPHARALRTVPVLRVRESATGFADSPSVDWRRTGPHRVGHPSDFSSAVSPRSRGPNSAHPARQSVSEKQSQSQGVRESASSLLRTMRSNRGPYAAAKWWRNCPQGGSHGCEPVGCQSRDGLSANPGTASRSRRAGCPETAASGWPFSWLLLFGHSKRSDSLA